MPWLVTVMVAMGTALGESSAGSQADATDVMAAVDGGAQVQHDGVGGDGFSVQVEHFDSDAHDICGAGFLGGQWSGLEGVRQLHVMAVQAAVAFTGVSGRMELHGQRGREDSITVGVEGAICHLPAQRLDCVSTFLFLSSLCWHIPDRSRHRSRPTLSGDIADAIPAPGAGAVSRHRPQTRRGSPRIPNAWWERVKGEKRGTGRKRGDDADLTGAKDWKKGKVGQKCMYLGATVDHVGSRVNWLVTDSWGLKA